MNKPKIAIYYHTNFGRNDGSPLYYFNVLKNQLDLNVVHSIPEGDTELVNGKVDYHIWVDYGEDGLPVDHNWWFPNDGGKTIYICSDAHIDEGGRNYRFNWARKFDYVFFNQARFIPEYAQYLYENKLKHNNICEPVFLPHAAEPQAYPNFNLDEVALVKKYDVCFIGHMQDQKNYNGFSRIDFLDRMFKEFPNFYFGTRNPQKEGVNMFEDASKKFGMSKVCLNISITDDLNMRLFEILSSGSFQLTNELPTLGELFQDGKHLVTYTSLDDAVQKAQYYIEHDDEREKIAQAGYEEFIKLHTYKNRVLEVLKTVGYPLEEETNG